MTTEIMRIEGINDGDVVLVNGAPFEARDWKRQDDGRISMRLRSPLLGIGWRETVPADTTYTVRLADTACPKNVSLFGTHEGHLDHKMTLDGRVTCGHCGQEV